MSLTQINKAGLDEIALDHVFTIGASGSSAYTFQGEGLNGTVNNPTLYLTRGKTYRFENGTGAHAIRIQSADDGTSGTLYNTGVTNNNTTGTVIVEVQHDAPDILYYQCASHGSMKGTLYITGALADGGVTTAKLADSGVTTAKIAADAVTNAKIADDSIDSEHYADGSIDTAHISNDAITGAKIADNAIESEHYADTSIDTAHISNSAITTQKIADDAVTSAKIADNPSFTGTSGIKLPIGTASERVNTEGILRYNSENDLPEYYNGTNWISIDSPPSVTAVSPTEVDSTASGNQSFTISGARFSVGATVKFVSSNGTEINASSVTRNSSSQLTAVAPRSSFVNAQEPYDVKAINSSGLSGELADQINVDSAPTWSTSAGALGTKMIGDSVSITVSATDAEGDTIAYSVSSGSLPSGLSINSSTGVISGTLGGSAATTTFDLRATAGSKTADRTFNIVSIAPASGGNNIVNYSHGGVNYKIHVFTSNGTFTRNGISTADVLVVGGGGGAGFGGGGAGALVWGTSKSLSSSTYTVTVGNGGSGTEGTSSSSGYANAGADSSFGSLVVAEGGGPGGRRPGISGGNSNSGPGGDGGSGGGGGHPSNGDASSGSGGSAVTGSSTGGTIYGNDGGAGFNCCNGGGGGGAGQVGQAGTGDPGNGQNVGGNGHSTFVGNAGSTAALLFAADLGTDGSGNATSGLGSDPGTLYLAGGGGGAYGSPRGGYGGGGTGGVSSGNTSGRTVGLANSGSGGGAANSVGKPGGSGVVLIRYTI